MNIKKLVSAVSALTIAASTFAGLAVTAGAFDTVTIDYEAESAVCDWTSTSTDRYTAAIAEEDGNHYLNIAAVGSGGNGTPVSTNSDYTATVDAGTDFTMTFDMAITGGNNQASTFQVLSADGYILQLAQSAANSTTWNINGSTSQTVDLTKGTFYSYTITRSGSLTYLTISKGDDKAFEQAIITSGSANGGVTGMTFATKRYYAALKLDNVVVRDIADGDLPSTQQGIFNIKYVTEDGTVLTTTKIGAGDAGTSPVLSDDMKAAFTEDGKKYEYVSDDSAEITLDADNAVTVTVTVSVVPTYTATVNAVADGNTIGTFTNSGFEGDTVRVYYSKYVENNGTYYVTGANSANPAYAKDFTAEGSADITYTATNVTYAAEIETLTPSHSWAADGGQTERYSNGAAKRLYSNSYVTLNGWTAAADSEVTITLWARNNSASQSASISVYTVDADGELTDTGIDIGEWATAAQGEKTATVTVPAGSKIVLNNDTAYNSNLELDYVAITATVIPTTVTATNLGVFSDDESLGTDGVATAFKAEMGDVTGTVDFAVTSNGETKTFSGATTLTDANAVLGIIIKGLSDAEATGVLTVE